MSKILIFTDIHIHPHKKNQKRLEDCLKVLEWVFDTANEHEVENVVFIGDLFHHRQKMEVLTYQRTFEIFQRYQHKIWLLIGNHDMWCNETWDVSSVIPLNAIPKVTVINKPCTLEIAGRPISFLPYTKNPVKELEKIKNDSDFKILFGHIALNGALLNVRAQTYSEVPVEDDSDMTLVNASLFKGWDQVFLGHYHAAQKIGDNIEYVGSPLQLSYGEAFQGKHILIYDLKNKTKQYVDNTFSPKHYIFPADDPRLLQIKDKAFIRIQVEDLLSPENVDLQHKLFENENTFEVKFEPIRKNGKEEKHKIEDVKSLLLKQDELAEKYIETMDTKDLDTEKLLGIFKHICKKRSNDE
jgi:DNA repair exonuclease SbcCD nuclease subunit